MKKNRDGVRLLTRSAPCAPASDVAAVLRPESGDHILGDGGERLPVAKELGDIDSERVEQQLVLAGIAVENCGVIPIGVDAPRAHADGDPAAQALLLVA